MQSSAQTGHLKQISWQVIHFFTFLVARASAWRFASAAVPPWVYASMAARQQYVGQLEILAAVNKRSQIRIQNSVPISIVRDVA